MLTSFVYSAIFGANVLDDEPFLVMDLHENGNARTFLKKNPEKNRLELVGGASSYQLRMLKIVSPSSREQRVVSCIFTPNNQRLSMGISKLHVPFLMDAIIDSLSPTGQYPHLLVAPSRSL
jgi:hypothetical protein